MDHCDEFRLLCTVDRWTLNESSSGSGRIGVRSKCNDSDSDVTGFTSEVRGPGAWT